MALTAAFLVLCVFHTALGQLKWVELKPSSGPKPAARRDSSIGYDSKRNQIVIFGGRSGDTRFDDTWIFDLNSTMWTKVNETLDQSNKVIPEKRFSMVFGNKGNYFYVSTGEGPVGTSTYYNDVNRFDFTTQKWEKLAAKSSVEPEKRYGSGGGVWPATGDGLYVTHGFSGVRYSNTFKFKFDTQVWEKKFNGVTKFDSRFPFSRCLHATTMFDKDEFVLYGGCVQGTGVNICPANDGWKYNGKTNVWTKLADCASKRTYTAMAMLPSNDPKVKRAVLYGGDREDPVSPNYEIVVFDPVTNKWMKKKIEGDVPTKRMSQVMVTTPQGIVVFGGQSTSGTQLNDVWLLKGNVSDVDKTASLPGCDAVVVTSTSAPPTTSNAEKSTIGSTPKATPSLSISSIKVTPSTTPNTESSTIGSTSKVTSSPSIASIKVTPSTTPNPNTSSIGATPKAPGTSSSSQYSLSSNNYRLFVMLVIVIWTFLIL